MNDSYESIERSVTTLMDVFGDVGGTYTMVLFIGYVIANAFSD